MGKIYKAGRSGFTMVELLIVLIIVGILAAVAAPIYSGNTQRAIASDAVAAMSLIRQAEREYALKNNGTFLVVADQALYGSALNVDLKVAQYFSNGSFGISTPTVFPVTMDSTLVGYPAGPVDFVIKANGANVTSGNQKCDSTHGTNCAVNADKAANICLQMDNAGRIFVNYSDPSCAASTGTWEKY